MDITTVKMTAKGAAVMQSIANREYGWFDNGLVEGSGIWGECICEKPGILTGLVKQGLLRSFDEDPDNPGTGKWYELTELGAAVAQSLEPKAAAPVTEDEKEVDVALEPMTKAQAYDMIKTMRKFLSEADEAVYRGTQEDLVRLLEAVQDRSSYMLDVAKIKGVNCGPKK